MTERLDDDKFAPLTAEELTVSVAAEKSDKGWVCIMPVPSDAPPLLGRHFELGTPSKTWVYRDAQGGVLFYVWRFETQEGKETRPVSLWRAANGRLEWRWKGVPEPRPLYGLDRLAEVPMRLWSYARARKR